MMNNFINHLISLALVAIFIPAVVDAGPYVISDDRVRSLDITPVLGRGYSIMTNSYQSTCLQVEDTTIPSYNYDCKYSSNLKGLILPTFLFVLMA